MAINSVSSAVQSVPQSTVNPQQVNARRDRDGDSDGSRAGEVEKSSSQTPPPSSSATVGTKVNTTA